MRCQNCRKKYPEPDIIEGTAYFVCPCCGNFHEEEDYKVLSINELMSLWEEKNGLLLPEDYPNYAENTEHWVIQTPPANSKTIEYYFGEGFYSGLGFMGFDRDDANSIFDSPNNAREWGLPSKVIPIEGDGHTWLALDYRTSDNNPQVIVIESDDGEHLVVSPNFTEFTEKLLKYEDIYDLDGNIIYKP